MVILVPWKPIVFVWLLLSAMFFFSCVAQSLIEGRNPFLPRGFYIDPVDHMGHIAATPGPHTSQHRPHPPRKGTRL